MVTGWNALGTTLVKLTSMARPPLFVKAPPLIETGECVLSPSDDVFLMFVRVIVRFWNVRDPVGMPTVIPVTAYRISESVNRFAMPASSTTPPQSPAVGAGQTPDAFWTKTEPQLGRTVCSLRLVSAAPVETRAPFRRVIVPPSTGA